MRVPIPDIEANRFVEEDCVLFCTFVRMRDARRVAGGGGEERGGYVLEVLGRCCAGETSA